MLTGKKFQLASWHNGLSYELRHLPSHTATFLQGEDAAQFIDDWHRAEAAFPEKSFDEIAMWLWDQHDYGSAAQPVESRSNTTDKGKDHVEI